VSPASVAASSSAMRIGPLRVDVTVLTIHPDRSIKLSGQTGDGLFFLTRAHGDGKVLSGAGLAPHLGMASPRGAAIEAKGFNASG
jgi:hypothetical protein